MSPGVNADTARYTAVHWAGETLHLLPEHAVWWPRERLLFVADVHLGKAASFRAAGQPVPHGTTANNLERLHHLVTRHGAHHLVVLGDFLHAAASRTPGVLDALQGWRRQLASVDITLVRGNHDSRAGDPPPDTGIRVVDEPWSMEPFAACHHPQTHPDRFVLAGHWHPVCRLRGPGRDTLRLPCYLHRPGMAVLPSFGAFTGGHPVDDQPGQTVYAVGGNRVWPVPPNL